MDKREFQQSNVAMLDFFDDLIGLSAATRTETQVAPNNG